MFCQTTRPSKRPLAVSAELVFFLCFLYLPLRVCMCAWILATSGPMVLILACTHPSRPLALSSILKLCLSFSVFNLSSLPPQSVILYGTSRLWWILVRFPVTVSRISFQFFNLEMWQLLTRVYYKPNIDIDHWTNILIASSSAVQVAAQNSRSDLFCSCE